MKLIDKLKNVFFEEVPDDEDEEELPQTFAKKVEIPKKPIEIKREAKTPIIKPIVTLERKRKKMKKYLFQKYLKKKLNWKKHKNKHSQ